MPEKRLIEKRNKLNPQIMEIEIGVRDLRKINIYPLSMADQLSTTDLITQTLQQFFKEEQDSATDMEFVAFTVNVIKENMGRLLSMATDEDGEKLLSQMTNLQASQVAEILYDVNFGSVVKNVQGLITKIKGILPSMRPLPQSAKDTDTESEISTEKATEKAA